MSLLGLLVPIIVVGVLLWLVQQYVPMAEPFKRIMIAVAVIVVVLWLLSVFGFLPEVRLPVVRG